VVSTTVIPLADRLLVALSSVAAYLGKMVAPVGLLPYYPYPRTAALLSAGTLAAVAATLLITAGCIAAARKERGLLAAWLYFLVTLLPVIGIIQVGRQSMADRYSYLPSLAPFIVAGCLVATALRCLEHRPGGRRALLAILALLVTAMGYATVRQIGVWRNGDTLWSSVITAYQGEEYANRDLSFVYSNRGIALHRAGRLDEALADDTKAVELSPKDDAYLKNRGTAYLERREFAPALADFTAAIRLNPANAGAYYNIACLHAVTNDPVAACHWLKDAIDHGYNDWENLAQDRDLENLRQAPCFREIMAGRK
jgi:tetratricopeptide (TPR) repeat protein